MNKYIYDHNGVRFIVECPATDFEGPGSTFSGIVVEVMEGCNYDVGHITSTWSKGLFVPYNPPNAHFHADLIHAWADGAEIEYYDDDDKCWRDVSFPSWNESNKYRIKPEKKEPEFETVNFVQWFDGENLFWLKEGVEPKFPSRKVKDATMSIEVEK